MSVYIGITGLPASGKEETKNVLLELLKRKQIDTYYWSISKDVRTEVTKHDYKRTDVSKTSAKLKEQFGAGVLAERAVNHLKTRQKPASKVEVIIMESVKNSHEVTRFRQAFDKQFILLGVQTKSIDTLAKRLIERKRYDEDESVLLDQREAKKLIESEIGQAGTTTGFDIGYCLQLADYIVENNGTLAQLNANVELFVNTMLLPLFYTETENAS